MCIALGSQYTLPNNRKALMFTALARQGILSTDKTIVPPKINRSRNADQNMASRQIPCQSGPQCLPHVNKNVPTSNSSGIGAEQKESKHGSKRERQERIQSVIKRLVLEIDNSIPDSSTKTDEVLKLFKIHARNLAEIQNEERKHQISSRSSQKKTPKKEAKLSSAYISRYKSDNYLQMLSEYCIVTSLKYEAEEAENDRLKSIQWKLRANQKCIQSILGLANSNRELQQSNVQNASELERKDIHGSTLVDPNSKNVQSDTTQENAVQNTDALIDYQFGSAKDAEDYTNDKQVRSAQNQLMLHLMTLEDNAQTASADFFQAPELIATQTQVHFPCRPPCSGSSSSCALQNQSNQVDTTSEISPSELQLLMKAVGLSSPAIAECLESISVEDTNLTLCPSVVPGRPDHPGLLESCSIYPKDFECPIVSPNVTSQQHRESVAQSTIQPHLQFHLSPNSTLDLEPEGNSSTETPTYHSPYASKGALSRRTQRESRQPPVQYSQKIIDRENTLQRSQEPNSLSLFQMPHGKDNFRETPISSDNFQALRHDHADSQVQTKRTYIGESISPMSSHEAAHDRTYDSMDCTLATFDKTAEQLFTSEPLADQFLFAASQDPLMLNDATMPQQSTLEVGLPSEKTEIFLIPEVENQDLVALETQNPTIVDMDPVAAADERVLMLTDEHSCDCPDTSLLDSGVGFMPGYETL